MSEQPWSREHPKVGVLGLDDWLLVQSASRTRDTGIVTLRQLREGGSRSIVPVRSVDANFEVGELSDEEMFGGVIFVTAEAVGTIPALPAGASFTVVTIRALGN